MHIFKDMMIAEKVSPLKSAGGALWFEPSPWPKFGIRTHGSPIGWREYFNWKAPGSPWENPWFPVTISSHPFFGGFSPFEIPPEVPCWTRADRCWAQFLGNWMKCTGWYCLIGILPWDGRRFPARHGGTSAKLDGFFVKNRVQSQHKMDDEQG